MAKGVNGTIDPDFEQVVQQRSATQGRNLSNFSIVFWKIDNSINTF